jgi:hypothetical protein
MRNDIPNDSANNFGARVRETLMTYLGKQGDPLDRGVTLRDLVESGFASLSNLRFGGGSAPLVAGSAIQSAYVADLTPPPTPTGLAATPAITSIVIACDKPTYQQGNGHLRSRVYGATRAAGAAQPVFADAVEITTFSGIVTSYATNPSTEWHLWLKWESVDGVLSVSPAGGTNGLVVTTGQDVATLLTALNGRIAAEQLQATLGARINLIDAPASTTNSVAWQVAQEASARASAISAEAAARASAISAEATSRANAVTNEASARAQAILDEAAARAAADSSLQTQINTISAASTGDLSSVLAAIQEEQTARTSADAAEATARSTLATQLRGSYTGTDPTALSTGLVYNERQARITAEGAISSTVSALTATVNTNTAAITSEATARANADTALSNSLSTLTATVNTNTAAITSEATARANADTALTNTVNSLTSTVNANAAAITSEASTRATADEALSTSISSLTTTVNANTAAITSEATTRANADTALTSSINTLTSTVNSNTAAIQTEATTRASADTALSNSISTLTSTVNGNTAAISAEATTRASVDTGLLAQYTIKADVNGYVSGFGLASTANNATPSSAFAVRADTLYIASPSGPGVTPTMPFIVRTTPTTINGVTVPVGVYMVDSYIQNGTITNAKIANAAIDNAKIADATIDNAKIANLDASKINAGFLDAARINANSLTADKIDSRNLTIKDSSGAVVFAAGKPLDIYAPYYNYDFTSSVEGFTYNGCTVSVADSLLTVTSISGDPVFVTPTISMSGKVNNIIRLKIRRLAGSGFDGGIFYSTTNHSFTESYKGYLPTIGTSWQVIEVDMASQAVGAPDWTTSTITQVRFDFGASTADIFEIDWISFGRYAPNVAIDANNVSTYISDAAITNAKIGNVIQSSNFVSGSVGWNIDKNGTVEFSNGTFRGSLNGANITGATGTFTGTLSAGTLDLAQLVGVTNRYQSPGTYYPVVPAGYTQMRITLVGAGGGGAGGHYPGSGGGGGGGLIVATYTVTPGQTITVQVGSGGAAGPGTNLGGGQGTAGTAGQNTTVYGYAAAGGGSGGGLPAGGAGGAGTINGSAGGAGEADGYTFYGGRGGNAANNYGIGGNGSVNYTVGTAGGLYGGGGGGGWFNTPGQPGASGLAIIEFFNPNGVIVRSEWATLISALQRQGIATT